MSRHVTTLTYGAILHISRFKFIDRLVLKNYDKLIMFISLNTNLTCRIALNETKNRDTTEMYTDIG